MDQYIPYSLLRDLFSRNLETYLLTFLQLPEHDGVLAGGDDARLARLVEAHRDHGIRGALKGKNSSKIFRLVGQFAVRTVRRKKKKT